MLSAAFQGARSVFGWPYSSAIIVSIQRPRLAVITATRALEVIAAKTLLAIDLADLLALAVGHEVDMPFLDGTQLRVLVALGLGAAEVAGGHREPVADEVGRTQDEHDPG